MYELKLSRVVEDEKVFSGEFYLYDTTGPIVLTDNTGTNHRSYKRTLLKKESFSFPRKTIRKEFLARIRELMSRANQELGGRYTPGDFLVSISRDALPLE